MTVARLYIIPAADGKSAEMEAALMALSGTVKAADGCEGVELMRDLGNEHRFIFIEKWASEEHHAKSLASLPEGALDGVQAAAGGPPDGAYYDYLLR
ncbi:MULTISPECIES: putative quinol monooxygenase [unclassified Sphingobium]|uniref:putative quinol monooxygenase n=1 Tax=unclassified Sphingobium TaxID=2611147 RepID=UPI0022243380|nr:MULTISPECIES: antibiotic biosynthesis monooxygenase family protein [unclassified Sphingobium]MCW2394173.1 quinol monooxygenase YgiN [Sphingobium sp. B8D3B]MCW2417687.1 quinol monooxygenase YgiN [Sphingobium sp. B8D3C]